MRLLQTTKLTFGEFFGTEVPAYCILSHRWTDDELKYTHVRDKRWDPVSLGYRKLHGACRLAAHQGFEWIWIDTCCIDKSSSAELTEAINSMFNYYRDAKLCIAYLSDVPSYRSQSKIHSRPDCLQSFKKSVWFSRGWTLQELLAPKHLDFYDRDFKFIGSRSNLSQLVSVVTGIDPKYLNGRSKLNEASVATRMSWASKRQTTRSEDEAYSLMGIFGVNMALLYGEGKRAFFRLQQQIIEYSDDESIFAWICPEAGNQEPFGMLAESPRNFQWSRDVYHVRVTRDPRPPFRWTSRGLCFSQCYEYAEERIGFKGKVALACKRYSASHKKERAVAIWLAKIKDDWYRLFCDKFDYTSRRPYTINSLEFQFFYVPQPSLTTTPRLTRGKPGDMAACFQDGLRRSKRQSDKQREQRRKAKRITAVNSILQAVAWYKVGKS